MTAMVFETYAPVYDGEIPVEVHENYMLEFYVIADWAIRWIDRNYKMKPDDFIADYTFDDSAMMYDDAYIADALIKEKRVRRDF